jgi:sugar lactone lactonase YvrE
MGTIKGQNLRVMVGGKCIAMATSCTFHVSAQLEDSSTKDSVGDFQEQEVTGLSWDAQTESLVTLEDNGTNGELPQDLLSLMINKTKVTLTFDQTAGTNNRVGQDSVIKKTGQAYITDMSVQAANRQNSTLSVQFTGTGPLS